MHVQLYTTTDSVGHVGHACASETTFQNPLSWQNLDPSNVDALTCTEPGTETPTGSPPSTPCAGHPAPAAAASSADLLHHLTAAPSLCWLHIDGS
jgi:hypothetical protein